MKLTIHVCLYSARSQPKAPLKSRRKSDTAPQSESTAEKQEEESEQRAAVDEGNLAVKIEEIH